MRIPTSSDLKHAQEEIRLEGPAAPNTLALGVLCLKEPLTRQVCQQMAVKYREMFAPGADLASIEGLVQGAFMAGLNLGLRCNKP